MLTLLGMLIGIMLIIGLIILVLAIPHDDKFQTYKSRVEFYCLILVMGIQFLATQLKEKIFTRK